MYFMGIDIGSLSCDAVLIDEKKNIVASEVVPTGAKNIEAIKRVTTAVLDSAGIDESGIKSIISTGYGRARVEKRSKAITEISCHAKGIANFFPGTRVLIDIGGQDSKAILLDENGNVSDFAMNDKCAAGTGRFLEAMARALQLDITELGDLGGGAKKNLTLNSMCTVFAESEVVSLIANGEDMDEIVSGMNRAISTRTFSLVKRIAPEISSLPIAMSGGVARNKGVVRALQEISGKEIRVPDEPDITGAFGAAVFALEQFR